ncbi:hypothetical protein [Mycetohabitans sp. B7]|uniref:hypothetical protein n=1 Tax=Mycetohabitans sp. B7 TaxID=2841844 RepID=UPI00351D6D34
MQAALVVYGLTASRRTYPKTGETFSSTLKPIGKRVTLCTTLVLTRSGSATR